jgi:predicted GNAT family acetyltransferase
LFRAFLEETDVDRGFVEHHMAPAKLRFVAKSGQKPVGFLGAKVNPKSISVPAVFVAEPHRRRGIMKKLTSKAVREARKRGLSQVRFNDISMYNKLFFKKQANSPKRKRLRFRTERYSSGVTDGVIDILD